MPVKQEFMHPEWGLIKIAVNRRARQIIMRAKKECIHLTVPVFATQKDIERALAMHGNKLKAQQAANTRTILPGYTVGNGKFRIEVQEYKGEKFMWVENGSSRLLMCPEHTVYHDIQEWLKRVMTNAIHEQAKKVLPQRLEQLAKEHGFKYNYCSVRNSHSRWGSCSGKGNISLSIYLVLLTDELIDYVLLHELCHTVEMNHGERFWEILDKVCRSNSKKIRNKLKRYTPEI